MKLLARRWRQRRIAAGWSALRAELPGGWPNKPVKIIVPFAAGGTDRHRRAPDRAEDVGSLGQQFYIENSARRRRQPRHGQAAQAPSRTATPSCCVIERFTRQSEPLQQAAVRPYNDFTPVTLAASAAERADWSIPRSAGQGRRRNWSTLHSEANPGKYSFASSGTGTHAASVGRIVQADIQARHRARAVRRRGSGDPVDRRRPHADRLHVAAATPVPVHQGRQAARARADQRNKTRCRSAARRADLAEAGIAGPGDRLRSRHVLSRPARRSRSSSQLHPARRSSKAIEVA